MANKQEELLKLERRLTVHKEAVAQERVRIRELKESCVSHSRKAGRFMEALQYAMNESDKRVFFSAAAEEALSDIRTAIRNLEGQEEELRLQERHLQQNLDAIAREKQRAAEKQGADNER